MKNILLTSPLPGAFIEQVARERNISGVTVTEGHGLTADALKEVITEADIIIGDFTFATEITDEVITPADRPRYILQPSVGYQHIDTEACRRAGITVANAAGANTVAVAEHTIAAALSLLKKLIPASESTLDGQWLQLELRPGELMGKTWGIVGMGRIGKAVAARLLPFGVTILYHDPVKMRPKEEKQYHAAFTSLDELLESSDIISLHCPLTDMTREIINRETLAAMKNTALIINVSRGEVIDEAALAGALASNVIGGAFLDVFSSEPVSADNPLMKKKPENLLLSPHIAGVSGESQMRIMGMTINNLVKILNGERPENVVN